MPHAMAIATIGSALAAGAASVFGAKKQGTAARDAAAAADRSTSEALALERENEMRRRQEWDQAQAENARRVDEANAIEERRYQDERTRAASLDERSLANDRFTQSRALSLDAFDREQYNTLQTQRAPYRGVSLQAMNQQAGLLGLPVSFTPSKPSMADLASRPASGAA